jgi:hypothetical protein
VDVDSAPRRSRVAIRALEDHDAPLRVAAGDQVHNAKDHRRDGELIDPMSMIAPSRLPFIETSCYVSDTTRAGMYGDSEALTAKERWDGQGGVM